MQAYADQRRVEGRVLALVPTMGGLHEGHLSLVRRAKSEADHVTVSIFVNPTQFGPKEDFDSYPRDFERDHRILQEIGGVSTIFAPSDSTFYPVGIDQQQTWVVNSELSEHLCGRYRPGHFQGVLTIVMKLLAACKPHICVFGRKDIQQFILVKQMVQDLSLDVQIIGEPIAREANGLACSSRNEYLTADERSQAHVLSEAVMQAASKIERGEQSPLNVIASVEEMIRLAPDAKLQYAEIVTANDLQPVKEFISGTEVIIAVAVYFRDIRLIDNATAIAPDK